MSWPVPGAVLMTGPRGRYLCWALLWAAMADAPETAQWDRVWEAARAGDLSGCTSDLASVVALADPAAILADDGDEFVLLAALAHAVEMADYWGEPDPVDRALRDPGAQRSLLPVARAVALSPAARWWPDPLARDSQQVVLWEGADQDPEPLSGASHKLAAWRSAELKDEHVRRPRDPAANWSGHWWSAPALSRLAVTTRALPGLGAAGLALVEDGVGWTTARCQPVSPHRGARVYEISGPQDWADLAASYPLEVTRSRRHYWWRVTGRAGTWLIPDYAAIAADYDAIHLTVLGYLTTAGRELPADHACTMLAGWSPDTTYWLTDSLSPAGPPTQWEQVNHQPARWTQNADR